MADKKISQLDAVTTVADTHEFVLSQNDGGGSYTSKKTLWSSMKSWLTGCVSNWLVPYTVSAGTNATNTIVIGAGTAPASSPTDVVQLSEGDFLAGAGKGALKIRSEDSYITTVGPGLEIKDNFNAQIFKFDPRADAISNYTFLIGTYGYAGAEAGGGVFGFKKPGSGQACIIESVYNSGLKLCGQPTPIYNYHYDNNYSNLCLWVNGDNIYQNHFNLNGGRGDGGNRAMYPSVIESTGNSNAGASATGGDLVLRPGGTAGSGISSIKFEKSYYGAINVDWIATDTILQITGDGKIGFYAATPVVKQGWTQTVDTVTDSTGGTPATTIPAPAGTDYTTAEIKNIFASLTDEINKLRIDNAALKTSLQNYGLIT